MNYEKYAARVRRMNPIDEVKEEGREEGRVEAIVEVYLDNDISLHKACKRLGLTEEEFMKEAKK